MLRYYQIVKQSSQRGFFLLFGSTRLTTIKVAWQSNEGLYEFHRCHNVRENKSNRGRIDFSYATYMKSKFSHNLRKSLLTDCTSSRIDSMKIFCRVWRGCFIFFNFFSTCYSILLRKETSIFLLCSTVNPGAVGKPTRPRYIMMKSNAIFGVCVEKFVTIDHIIFSFFSLSVTLLAPFLRYLFFLLTGEFRAVLQ